MLPPSVSPADRRGAICSHSFGAATWSAIAPIGGVFAGTVAQLVGAPAGFVLGASIAVVFLALVAWKLRRRPTDETIGASEPASAAPSLRLVRDDD